MVEKEGEITASVVAADEEGVYVEQAVLTDETGTPSGEAPAITAAPASSSAETEPKPAAPPRRRERPQAGVTLPAG